MKIDHHTLIDRLAWALHSLLSRSASRRTATRMVNPAARDEVNHLLDQVGDDVMAQTLHQLYRLAVREVRDRTRQKERMIGHSTDASHPTPRHRTRS